ncbi:hypothetical protein [Tenacibaculum sp. M341]|uniref:hypothetical protein n=1 Tax=Tenacibaculum sp. M341 TaxID=2530339 RepID=UPI001053EDBD|nr:hypothetical protein [Tenacibaculum sp. M341]TCI91455.1 hypothetical protein EYW44_10910 [Tenacibaculum sp. M341]
MKVSNESCFNQNLDAYKEEYTFLNYSNVGGGKDNFYRYVKNFNDWLQNHMYLEDRYHDFMIWYTNEKVYFNLEKGVSSKKLSSEFAKLNMFYPVDNLKDVIDVFVDYVSDVIGKCEWNKGKLNEVYKITIEEGYKELKILAKEYRNEKKDWEDYCENLQVFFDNLPQKKDYEYYLIRNSFLYWKDLLVIGIKRNKPTDYDIFAYLLGDSN